MSPSSPRRLALAVLLLAGTVGCATSRHDVALEQGRLAATEGRWEHARAHYTAVLDATASGDPERAEALYGAALVELRSTGDLAATRRFLTELHDELQPKPLSFEADTVLALVDGLTESRRAEEEAVAALATRDEEVGELATELGGDPARMEGDDEIEVLRRRLAEVREELERTKVELQRKDEALRQVREALVGRDNGP